MDSAQCAQSEYFLLMLDFVLPHMKAYIHSYATHQFWSQLVQM